MKASVLLKIAAVIGLLFCIGHSLGYPWLPADKATAASVAASIKAIQFHFGGQARSLWEFYTGFGLIISIVLLVKAVALWLAGQALKREDSMATSLMVLLLLGYLANAWISWRFFFMLPAMFALVISILILMALLVGRRSAR